jgi:hypothetical protein
VTHLIDLAERSIFIHREGHGYTHYTQRGCTHRNAKDLRIDYFSDKTVSQPAVIEMESMSYLVSSLDWPNRMLSRC